MTKLKIPDEIELLRSRVLKAIKPIREADDNSSASKNFFFAAQRTNAGRELPQYYLVYFLLVDLLKFRNLGQSEKVSWSVLIDFNGKAFVVEHRKFGIGVFVEDPNLYEDDAKQIVTLIKKGIKIAEPYFEWLAAQAVEKSALNVTNKGYALFDKFEYFLKSYKEKSDEAAKRMEERHVEKLNEDGTALNSNISAFELRRNAKWLALSAIDSFFSWTEHIFIHLALLRGEITTGTEVANMAEADWQQKFKLV